MFLYRYVDIIIIIRRIIFGTMIIIFRRFVIMYLYRYVDIIIIIRKIIFGTMIIIFRRFVNIFLYRYVDIIGELCFNLNVSIIKIWYNYLRFFLSLSYVYPFTYCFVKQNQLDSETGKYFLDINLQRFSIEKNY